VNLFGGALGPWLRFSLAALIILAAIVFVCLVAFM
jgi:hypothetical protein